MYAIASDKTGRTYTEQAVITVTDAPEMELDIDKETVYIQETVRVSTRLSNIGDSEIAWYIEKNGEKKPYNDYVTGTLSNLRRQYILFTGRRVHGICCSYGQEGQ